MSNGGKTRSAILLAAGVGKRLGASHDGPKVLLDFDGRTLLARHMAALAANGVERLSITVGHLQEAIRTAAELAPNGLTVSFVDNPDYRQGSLVSLQVQGDLLRAGEPVLLMDGDVLYDARMIARLNDASFENTLLVDRNLEPGDEPVKVCFRGETIVDFRKQPEHAYDWHGESVGFFRFSPEMAVSLAARCDDYVRAGRTDVEYEEAIRDMILAEPARFGAADVSDLPWTEIDFEGDVARARAEILPQLEG
ncbi:MAG: phosphocholine cytidylyltransferase family protein [Caulobacteraceae bacterium]